MKVNAACSILRESGDNIRHEPAFEQLDFVLDAQLAPLHPRNLQLVDATCLQQGHDGGIKIAMFLSQQAEPLSYLLRFEYFRHRTDPALPIPVFNWSHSP